MTDERQVIVVGGGAGGLMAAGRAAEQGARVLLLEKTDRPAKKLLITGQTRCNLTNTRPIGAFLEMFGPNGQFLRNAFYRFFRDDLLALLARYGVPTKTAPDGKVFPASDDARDVVRALERYCADGRIEVRTRTHVTGIETAAEEVQGVRTERGVYPASAVVLATGGASYPGTGSSGDGYAMAAALGHRIVRPRPALVPLVVREADLAGRMQGVSLADVRLTVWQCRAEEIDPRQTPATEFGRGLGRRRPPPPVVACRRGNVMLTHNGLGGPATLLASLAALDALERGPVSVSIDLRPDLDFEQTRVRLQAQFTQHGRRSLRGVLRAIVAPKMVEPLLDLSGVSPEKPAHEITADERERLALLLKALRFNVVGPLSMAAAIVTAGGVALDEIDPRTCGSRLLSGLFFCGEVMDLDADTGGYNLQAVFSTGSIAGESAAAYAAADHLDGRTTDDRE
jgi:predicted flavoprotein YhiN